MDTAAIASLATAMSQTRTGEALQVAVLKKALDVEANGALQLLAAAAQVSQAVSSPPHLGNGVDTYA